MRILIAEYDIFSSVGGGQTVYQNLIKHRPDDEFYYFSIREPVDLPRPQNCRLIPFLPTYSPNLAELPEGNLHLYQSYMEAQNLAAAAHRMLGETRFDVIDTPD